MFSLDWEVMLTLSPRDRARNREDWVIWMTDVTWHWKYDNYILLFIKDVLETQVALVAEVQLTAQYYPSLSERKRCRSTKSWREGLNSLLCFYCSWKGLTVLWSPQRNREGGWGWRDRSTLVKCKSLGRTGLNNSQSSAKMSQTRTNQNLPTDSQINLEY